MTKEQIYKKEHDLLKETLSLMWEFEKPEEKIAVGYYICGISDMTCELLRTLDEVENERTD